MNQEADGKKERREEKNQENGFSAQEIRRYEFKV